MFSWSEPGLRLVGGWVYPALVPVVALLAFLVYRVTQPPVSRSRRLLLTSLRTGALAMLLVSLAEPILSLRHRSVLRPVLTVLLDTSPSMEVEEAEGTRLSQVLSLVGGTEWRQALSRFVMEPWAFSQQATPVAADTVARLRSGGQATDLGRAIQGEPGQGSPSAQPRAILLLSDGGQNLGYDPVRAAAEAGVPVFCLSVGTVTGPPDAAVVAVRVDEEAHVGRPLSVEAVVRSSGRQGVQASVRLFTEGYQVAAERLTLPADGVDLPVGFVWRPARSGPHLLRAVLESPPGEVWRENDEARMLVRVREQRACILVVAGGPGPELTFLLRALAADSSLTVTTRVYRGNGVFYDAGMPVPSVAAQDAVVLVDPTLDLLTGSFGEEVAARVRQGGGLLFIGGPHSAEHWGTPQPLVEVLPVVPRPGFVTMGVPLKPAAEGRSHPLGRLAQGSGSATPEAWSSLPPLPGYLAISGLRPNAVRIVEGAEGTRPPIIVAGSHGLGRVVVGLSTSFWRLDLMSTGVNGRPQTIREFWRAALRWLALESPGGRVRVATERPVYRAGETVGFTAQVLNEFMQPHEAASVTVTLSGEGGTRTLQPQGGGRFSGEWPGMGPGDYTFTGEAVVAGAVVGTDQGRFIVEEHSVEATDLRANPALLAEIARAGGGVSYPLAEWRQLVAALPLHPRLESRAVDLRWWPSAWVVTVVLLLLTAEWLLRRRWGLI